MRAINRIIVHCSATPEGRDNNARDIKSWHKAKGWSDIGYHFVIKLDGTIETGRPIQRRGAHCKGKNTGSIGICYIGGVDSNMKAKDTRTDAQRSSLRELLLKLKGKYPKVVINGHRDFAAKACPSFDATSEYSDI